MSTRLEADDELYPDSDGEPMADNDPQLELMFTLRAGLIRLFAGPDAYVGSNSFWYPVEGEPTIARAPDVYLAFGRSHHLRRTYRQWEEGGHPPDWAMEIMSQRNTRREMAEKRDWYERYGVREYVVFEQLSARLELHERVGELLVRSEVPLPWTSPMLGVTFDLGPSYELAGRSGRLRRFHTLTAVGPDGVAFTPADQLTTERDAAAAERDAAAAERDVAAAERDRLAAERDALLARLREAGLEP